MACIYILPHGATQSMLLAGKTKHFHQKGGLGRMLSVQLILINSIQDTTNVLSVCKLLNKAIRSRWLSVATS